MLIYWHYVGREHGGLDYAPDLRRNEPAVVEAYLAAKEAFFRARTRPNRYFRHDERTLIELHPKDGREFIVVYRRDLGLQFSLGMKVEYPWWLIDIVDVVERAPEVFCARDLFVDISVDFDMSYEVWDIEDLERAIGEEILSVAEARSVLRRLAAVLEDLNASRFPPSWLTDLADEYGVSA